jgi:hypothetical protein
MPRGRNGAKMRTGVAKMNGAKTTIGAAEIMEPRITRVPEYSD